MKLTDYLVAVPQFLQVVTPLNIHIKMHEGSNYFKSCPTLVVESFNFIHSWVCGILL